MSVIIGIDVGTSSVKALALDTSGKIICRARMEHKVSIPKAGYAEHDPENDWWLGIIQVVHQLLSTGLFHAKDVSGIGVSAIAPCVVALDSRNEVIRPAILYGIDVRAAKQIDLLNARFTNSITRYGQSMSSQLAGPKMLWMKENESDSFQRASRFVSSTTYLVNKLTGEWWLDWYTAPSLAPAFRIDQLKWDEEYIAECLSPSLNWPKLGWATDLAGFLTPEAARDLSLIDGIPVVVGTADAFAEAVAANGIDKGKLFVMYGSSVFFIASCANLHVGEFWPAPALENGQWVLTGGMSASGTLIDWWANQAQLYNVTHADVYKEAANSPPGSNGIVALPYFSGERTPINDPLARGIIAGLTLSHSRADLFRAILESIAFGIRNNFEKFQQTLGPLSLVAAGGGIRNRLLPQIVADVCKVPQEAIYGVDSAFGDALIAGVGIGCFNKDQLQDITRKNSTKVVFHPNSKNFALYDQNYNIFQELYRNTRELIHKLNFS